MILTMSTFYLDNIKRRILHVGAFEIQIHHALYNAKSILNEQIDLYDLPFIKMWSPKFPSRLRSSSQVRTDVFISPGIIIALSSSGNFGNRCTYQQTFFRYITFPFNYIKCLFPFFCYPYFVQNFTICIVFRHLYQYLYLLFHKN